MHGNYAIDYQTPREIARLTREQVTLQLADRGIEKSIESLSCYERGARVPSPEIVSELAEIYKTPFMTQEYCKYHCEIGRRFSYEILDNIDNSISTTALKLMQEHKESFDVLPEILGLIVNKTSKKDFTDYEYERLKTCFHELLDTEHTIEVFKISMSKFLDMKEMIREHNEKCVNRGYAKRKAPKSGNSTGT